MTLTRRQTLVLPLGLAAFTPALAWAQEAGAVVDYGIGDPNAKVKLEEYLSFTCPHCAKFHANIHPRLKADYIDKGLVRLDYHEVYFDKYGLWAAMLARCGGEMRYAGIVDLLFAKQKEWAGTDDAMVAVAELKKIGLIAGIDEATADACLKDQAVAEALVGHYRDTITAHFPDDSFGGTPAFRLNGVVAPDIVSNMDYADLQRILDAELAK